MKISQNKNQITVGCGTVHPPPNFYEHRSSGYGETEISKLKSGVYLRFQMFKSILAFEGQCFVIFSTATGPILFKTLGVV